MGVLDIEEIRDNDNEIGLKEGGGLKEGEGIEMSTSVLPFAICSLSSLFFIYLAVLFTIQYSSEFQPPVMASFPSYIMNGILSLAFGQDTRSSISRACTYPNGSFVSIL